MRMRERKKECCVTREHDERESKRFMLFGAELFADAPDDTSA